MIEVKGIAPEWELLYSALRETPAGGIVTYAQLDDALGRDFRSSREPLDKARKALEREDNRTIQSVRDQGYRVVEGDAQIALANARSKRARRQINKGLHTSRTADRNKMSEKAIEWADRIERNMEFANERLTRMEAKATRTEVRVENVEGRVSDIEVTSKHDRDTFQDRLAKLQAQIDKLADEQAA